MNVVTATKEYEAWLGRFCLLNQKDLDDKHTDMKKGDPFPFFRGTYYLWGKRWQKSGLDVLNAPQLLSIGDLHIENFGTWRDIEGRLCWGNNDFDEADTLPYTHDLVRLAASVRFAQEPSLRALDSSDVCHEILDGYHDCLKDGGKPFVLEEKHKELRALATNAEREPEEFWKEYVELAEKLSTHPTPVDLQAVLVARLPPKSENIQFRFRAGAGMGSRGKPRYIALAHLTGSLVCREAKFITPPATAWARGSTAPESHLAESVSKAVRSHDPEYKPEGNWIVRRLAPRCSRIKFKNMDAPTAKLVLRAMGKETANVHLGMPGKAAAILDDLKHRPNSWLEAAAKQMFDAVEADWKAYQNDG